VEFLDTSQVGYYRVETGGSASEFAVNLSSETESDVRPRFASVTGGTAAAGAAAPAAGTETLAWAAFAFAALALILLEWVVWLRTAEGSKPASSQVRGRGRG
jgi:hypothetical protein